MLVCQLVSVLLCQSSCHPQVKLTFHGSFAFRFLVESHKILRRVPKEQNTSILGRIKKACLGHLKWLHLSQEQNGQRFGDSYWVNGKLTVEPDFSSSRMPVNSLLDTGFQILKVAACTDLFTSKDTPAELMSEWALSWLDSMERSDRRQKYAWPHAEDEGVNKFRLDDHVWIWRALKSLESHDGKVWTLMSQKVCAIGKHNAPPLEVDSACCSR